MPAKIIKIGRQCQSVVHSIPFQGDPLTQPSALRLPLRTILVDVGAEATKARRGAPSGEA